MRISLAFNMHAAIGAVSRFSQAAAWYLILRTTALNTAGCSPIILLVFDQLISIVTASTIMAYSLYTFTAERSEYFMLSIPFVIYGIFRYLFWFKNGVWVGAEDVLLQDKPFIINVCLWAVVCVVILHFEAV